MKPPGQDLVFITGASSGIGQALALRYQQAGYRLALVARRSEAIEAWAVERGLAPDSYAVYGADVSDTDSIVAAAQACIARQGLPDVVIANAGISIGIDNAQREDIDAMSQVFATNNIGLAASFQPFIENMRERGRGRLVGIASVAGIRGLPGHAAYCASKAAVISYCEALRGELRGTGVQVITIAPGYVDTPLTRKNRYPMPFLMSASQFADQAYKAITAGDSYRVIPSQMGLVSKLMRVIPNTLWDRILERQPRKHRGV